MPLVIPLGFSHVAVELRHDLDPDPWYVTWGVDSSGLEGEPLAIAVHSMQAFHNAFALTISPTIHITGAEVAIGQGVDPPLRSFHAAPTVMSGVANDDRLPQNCALLVRKNTGTGGRRSRGRIFVPGVLAEVAVSPTGVISPGGMVSYQDYADTLFSNLESEGTPETTPAMPMVLLHSTGISPVTPPDVVTSLSVDNVISTQRRRLR